MTKIVVVGDVMLDTYYYGIPKFNPESREGLVIPARRNIKTDYKPGGAGNVAANLAALGGDFLLLGLVGNDPMSYALRTVLEREGINHHLILDETRHTIVKQRFMVMPEEKNEMRWDFEEDHPADERKTEQILAKTQGYDLILVSDYNKGAITKGLVERLIASGRKVIVDTKPEHMDFFKGAYLIKPNEKEIRDGTHLQDGAEAARKLREELGTRILLTLGERGLIYFGFKDEGLEDLELPAYKHSRPFVDFTGAGDTVIAGLAYFLAKGAGLEFAIRGANIAAGISVTYPGCHPVSEKEILEVMK